MDVGLLIARLVFGLLLAVHGSQKLFGWYGGPGLTGTAAWLESIGFRPGRLFALAVALEEFGAGLLLAAGLFEPLAAAAILGGMIVAIATVHWGNGLLAITNGIELPLLYMAAATSLSFTGSGAYSLSALFGMTGWFSPQLNAIILASGVVGGFASLAVRRLPKIAHA